MLSSGNGLGPGAPIFHPKYGFGTVNSLTRRNRIDPMQKPTASAADSDGVEDYYEIDLFEGGTLLVPASRAQSVGLRRLTNGIAEIRAELCSPAQSLPENFRERTALLREREQLPEPNALAHAIRDMLAQSRGRALSGSEKKWLDRCCQRLVTEASVVDHISTSEARAAIWGAIQELTAQKD